MGAIKCIWSSQIYDFSGLFLSFDQIEEKRERKEEPRPKAERGKEPIFYFLPKDFIRILIYRIHTDRHSIMSHDTSSNPILSAYKTYYTSTPLATRLTLNAATVFYILSYFIDTQQILSCIPSQAIFHFQFYRFFFSPFLCDGIVTLIFSYISLLHHGLRLELSMGSTNFAAMVICLSLMPSVIISIFGILSQNSFVMSVPLGGIWIIVFAVMAVECSYAPRGETRRFFMADVPTRYYPCVLLGLVTLFSGGNFPYTYVISVILGYLYGFGKLDWLKIGYERRKELEANVLRKFASMQGFTPGPSTDHWSMIDRTVGILGIWNNSRAGGVSDTNERRNDGHQVRTFVRSFIE